MSGSLYCSLPSRTAHLRSEARGVPGAAGASPGVLLTVYLRLTTLEEIGESGTGVGLERDCGPKSRATSLGSRLYTVVAIFGWG